MGVFNKAPKIIAPAEEPYEVKRRREVLADIERLQTEMRQLDLRMRLFREQHFALINGRPVWRLKEFGERPLLETELRQMEKARDELVAQWHSILTEHAALATR